MSKQFQRTHGVLFICCIELWTKAVLSSDPAFFTWSRDDQSDIFRRWSTVHRTIYNILSPDGLTPDSLLSPPKSVRTDGVRWCHYQIFSDVLFTKFSYPWCSAGVHFARAKAPLFFIFFFEAVSRGLDDVSNSQVCERPRKYTFALLQPLTITVVKFTYSCQRPRIPSLFYHSFLNKTFTSVAIVFRL